MDWFKIGKGVHQNCILSLCLFSLYAKYITQNVRLDEAQAGIKMAGRNINKLRCADDTTSMEESEEELKSLLMRVKEEREKADLKLFQKAMTLVSAPIASWQKEEESVEAVTDFLFLGSKATTDSDCSHEIKTVLLLGRKAMTNLDSKLKSRDITLLTNVI